MHKKAALWAAYLIIVVKILEEIMGKPGYSFLMIDNPLPAQESVIGRVFGSFENY